MIFDNLNSKHNISAQISNFLHHFDYENALFLSERWFAESKTDESLYFYALSLYRSGRPRQTCKLLSTKGVHSVYNKFLLAQCFMDMTELAHAEEVLLGSELSLGRLNTVDSIAEAYGESLAPFALRLLGELYRRTDRHVRAADCFNKALSLQPLMWSCFQHLADMGFSPDPNNTFCGTYATAVFPVASAASKSANDSSLSEFGGSSEHGWSSEAQSPDTALITPDNVVPLVKRTGRALLASDRHSLSPTSELLLQLQQSSVDASPQLTRKLRSLSTTTTSVTETSAVSPNLSTGMGGPRQRSLLLSNANNRSDLVTPVGGPVLRSHRHSGGIASAFSNAGNGTGSPGTAKENSGVRTRAQTARAANAAARKARSSRKEEVDEATQKDPASLHSSQMDNISDCRCSGLLSLLRQLGVVYSHLANYKCSAAVSALDQLPAKHYYTSRVLSWLGRAYFEEADYPSACRAYEESRRLEPWSLFGMDRYSTALWQLQKDMSLSALAASLLELDRQSSPEPWCAAGNCFSLQREHAQAVRFFRRALQVCPAHAYAYCLLGAELSETEDLEAAQTAFRSALRHSPRHYVAWYGLAKVYFMQEKFHLAEAHMRRALNVRPDCEHLLTHLGSVRAQMGRQRAALECLDRAIQLAPRRPLARFHRAKIYFVQNRLDEALQELEIMKQLTPKESQVYFLLGRVYKKQGREDLAMLHFSWAMDLDPKGANCHLKDMLEARRGGIPVEPVQESNASNEDETVPIVDGEEEMEEESLSDDTASLGQL